MNEAECMGRLTASATHDLRNVLAAIRESVGLVQDILELPDPAGRVDRMRKALRDVQQQVAHGAELAEGMAYLAQCGAQGEGASAAETRCDLARVTRDFCRMAARRGKACALALEDMPPPEPILTDADPLEVFGALLGVFDACAAVGGGARVRLGAVRRGRATGILCEVDPEGTNVDMVISALTGCPLLHPENAGWAARLLPWRDAGARRFLLPVSGPDADGKK